jgi:integrase
MSAELVHLEQPALLIPQPGPLVLVQAGPLDRNPAAVYLSRLAAGPGRDTQRRALDTIAGILTAGRLNFLSCPWAQVQYQHAAAIRAALATRYAPATANRMLAALRGVLQEAWHLGLIDAETYYRAAAVPTVRGASLPAGRNLASGEISALLEVCAADPSPAGLRDAAAIGVLYGGGLRRAELAGLDLFDWDAPAGALVIRAGKGHKDRRVYLPTGAAAALQDWRGVRGAAAGPLFCAVNKAGHLVGDRRLGPHGIYTMLRRRGRQAGVQHFSPHDLRRTFVGDLLDRGADIVTVAKMAGHANVATTARYDRRGDDVKRRAADLLHVPYHGRPDRPGD